MRWWLRVSLLTNQSSSNPQKRLSCVWGPPGAGKSTWVMLDGSVVDVLSIHLPRSFAKILMNLVNCFFALPKNHRACCDAVFVVVSKRFLTGSPLRLAMCSRRQ
jgi:hypothetical protein